MNRSRVLQAAIITTLFSVAAVRPQQGGEIAYGETIEGQVAGEDGERWIFTGEEGDEVRIDMRSEDLDTYVQLLDADEEFLADNDDAVGSDSRIEAFVLPYSGQYIILAMSYFMEETGTYTLSLERTGIGVELVTGGGSISYGDVLRARLVDEQGDEWTFEGNAGDEIRIGLTSPAIDGYLELYGPDGDFLLSDDDSGSDFNALIDGYVLPETGRYMIVAYGLAEETGAYRLALEKTDTGVEVRTGGGFIQYGQTVESRVVADGGDVWTFVGSAGDVVRITMASDGFDTYVELWDPESILMAENDGIVDVSDAIIENYWLPATGTYSIVARSYYGDLGDYQLTLERQRTTLLSDEVVIAGGIVVGTLLCVLGVGFGLVLGIVLSRRPRPPADERYVLDWDDDSGKKSS